MTHDEMIAVIQAHKDGKEIECRSSADDSWDLITDPSWNFWALEYRVKPLQIEAWCLVGDGEVKAFFDKKQWAENYRGEHAKTATLIRLIPDPNYTQSPVSDNE